MSETGRVEGNEDMGGANYIDTETHRGRVDQGGDWLVTLRKRVDSIVQEISVLQAEIARLEECGKSLLLDDPGRKPIDRKISCFGDDIRHLKSRKADQERLITAEEERRHRAEEEEQRILRFRAKEARIRDEEEQRTLRFRAEEARIREEEKQRTLQIRLEEERQRQQLLADEQQRLQLREHEVRLRAQEALIRSGEEQRTLEPRAEEARIRAEEEQRTIETRAEEARIRAEEERQRVEREETDRLKWDFDGPRLFNEENRTVSISCGSMYFVNRDKAVEKLIGIHYKAFLLSRLHGKGGSPVYPLIDDTFGMGKTTLASNYIWRCQGKLAKYGTEFENSISKAQTVLIRLSEAELITPYSTRGYGACDLALKNCILKSLNQCILAGTLKGDLSRMYGKKVSSDFLVQSIIAMTRTPLFLVFDEVGAAFHSRLPLVKRREALLHFWSQFLGRLVLVRDLYVLLIGRGDVFDILGTRPLETISLTKSRIRFERIPLNLIRERYIGEILQKSTVKVDSLETSLIDYFKIKTGSPPKKRNNQDENCQQNESISDMTRAVRAILRATNGHPRSVLCMLQSCDSIEALESYAGDLAQEDVRIPEWIDSLRQYQSPVKILLAAVVSKAEFNLVQNINDDEEKPMNFLRLAAQALFRWEGQIGAVTLYVNASVGQLLADYFSPCTQFISLYSQMEGIRLNHEANFSICCLKRFQELFANDACPATKYPTWFGSRIFGKLDFFSVSNSISRIPEVTNSGKLGFCNINQGTVHKRFLNELFQEMESMRPHCFIPGDKSASSDVFIIGGCRFESQDCIVTVRLTGKTVLDTPFPNFYAEPEVKSPNPKATGKRPFPEKHIRRLNILIVCCSSAKKPNENLDNRNFSYLSTEGYPNVDEAIYLDLSSREMRSEFFGIENDHSMTENLERMLKKELRENN